MATAAERFAAAALNEHRNITEREERLANRQAVKRYYARNGKDILKRRMESRIYNGSIPTSVSMERYGLELSDVNRIRRQAGLSALDANTYPLRPRDPDIVPSLKAEVARKRQDERIRKQLEDTRKLAEAVRALLRRTARDAYRSFRVRHSFRVVLGK